MIEIKNSIISKIAILGGTGKEGKGLGYRWALAGYTILIGSRQLEKAQSAAQEIYDLVMKRWESGHQSPKISGMTNEQAAVQGDIVVITVPYSVHRTMLESMKLLLQGKILVDVTVPLVPPKVSMVQMPQAGSASIEAQQILGEEVQVVAAFQNISYENLLKPETPECDVLVCGGNKTARGQVLKLVQAADLVGWDAGPLENAVVVEGMTSVLIGLNKKYGASSAGIRITGISKPGLK